MREWLIKSRKEKGMVQKDLADLVGVDSTYVVRIEKGQRDPSVAVAIKIGKVLNFDWCKFYEQLEKEINDSELG